MAASPECLALVARIVAGLKAAGLREPEWATDPCRSIDGAVLTDPAKARSWYLGTYLNQFSLDDPVRLWSDQFARDWPEVVVRPVYRHNGAERDVSAEIVCLAWHPRPYRLEWRPDSWDAGRIRDAVRAEAPADYTLEGEISSSGGAYEKRVAKLRPGAGERAVVNAVKKAMEWVAAFVPQDLSAWEQDRSRYHADTTAEHFAAVQAKRGAEAAQNGGANV